MPNRRRSANRSCNPSVSAQTRAMIDPTVRQAMRINWVTALSHVWVANPGHRLIKGQRVTRAMPSPRHVRHDNAMLGAGHPRRVGLDHRLHRAQIQRPPAASSFTGVVPPAAALADSTAPCSGAGRPDPTDQHLGVLVELDSLHDGLLRTEKGMP